jgi:hypothetical protein
VNDDDMPPPSEMANAFAPFFQQLGAGLQPIIEAAKGVKEQLKAAGFGPEASDRMAAEYYAALLRMFMQKAFGVA